MWRDSFRKVVWEKKKSVRKHFMFSLYLTNSGTPKPQSDICWCYAGGNKPKYFLVLYPNYETLWKRYTVWYKYALWKETWRVALTSSVDFDFSKNKKFSHCFAVVYGSTLSRVNNKSRNWLNAVTHSPFSLNNKAKFWGEKIVGSFLCYVVVSGRYISST